MSRRREEDFKASKTKQGVIALSGSTIYAFSCKPLFTLHAKGHVDFSSSPPMACRADSAFKAEKAEREAAQETAGVRQAQVTTLEQQLATSQADLKAEQGLKAALQANALKVQVSLSSVCRLTFATCRQSHHCPACGSDCSCVVCKLQTSRCIALYNA